MKFRKYQHIERLGVDEVQGIELGEVFIFPKIDGTNGSVWWDKDHICAGSRNRQLGTGTDNFGFCQYVEDSDKIQKYMRGHDNQRLFGEWLVPHSLKTYRDEAWRRFYIFDVAIDKDDDLEYLSYDLYQPPLEEYHLDYIPLLCKIKNGNYDQFIHQLENNVFLVQDGKGTGEGVVLKNYDFYNKFGRQTWAKIVRSEFKEVHSKTMGAPEIDGKKMVEEEIATEYCTGALIDKVYAEIVAENDGWRSQYIPKLLNVVFYNLIIEESWHFLKKLDFPTVNYKTLKYFVINRIKEYKREVFS